MFNRREFIKTIGLTTTGIAGFGGSVFAAASGKKLIFPSVFSPIRIRGRVTTGGTGLHRVVISDGRSVVTTNSSGEFELNSSTDRDFVFVSVPAGFELKKLANGSSDFFLKIDKTKTDQNLYFDLKKVAFSDENHHFLLLSDTQIQNEYEAINS